jgi:dethiobiotin synthetase
MAGYFITGTGTDIGKTWLSCALLRHWRTLGVAVRACKPVMSGFDESAMDASDAGALLAAQGIAADLASVNEIAPWRFAAPLSPDMAAKLEQSHIDYAQLIAFTRRLTTADIRGTTLVEGVGGVMVPLDASHTVLDWIADSRLPAVLVTGSYLGSMSHTLTALRVLLHAGVPVAVVVINETPGSSVDLEATRQSLLPHCGGVPLVSIPRAAADRSVATLADILQASLNTSPVSQP